MGATAVPSLSGNGAYVQYGKNFYEISCTTTACTWEIMEQELSTDVTDAVMMYLPPEFTC